MARAHSEFARSSCERIQQLVNRRFAGLDVLRAVAIIWVLFFHAQTLSLGSPLPMVTELGWMGVDLFFVLSGFLIGRQWLSQGASPSFSTFYRRRAFRILPAYAVVVAIYFVLPAARERRVIQPLWQFLTFTENLFIDMSSPKAFSHVWSLCVEEHFYLVFPLLAWALMRKPSRAVTITFCVAVMLAGMLWRGFVWFDALAMLDEQAMSKVFYERIYYPTLTRLDGLLMGVVLAIIECHASKTWQWLMQRARWLFIFGAATLALAIALFADAPNARSVIIGYPVLAIAMALIVASASSEHAWFERVKVPGAAWVAAISYSLYLSHKFVFHLVHVWFGSVLDEHGALAIFTYAAASMSFGFVLHLAVEKPFLQLRTALEKRSRVGYTPLAASE